MNELATTRTAKRGYHHRESPIDWFLRRGQLAPLDPALKIALAEAAARYREHWLARDRSEYHGAQYAAACNAISSFDGDVLRVLEAVTLYELTIERMGTDIVPGKNHGRRRAFVITRLHLGLQLLTQHFATRPSVDQVVAF